ncbi:PIG-L family deacetylase [Saccharopolyspora sp. MS10]|uniref:PIG-L family deacetylase n=1 Tax=Saccharopolyspora sp. MS10 TaxID=3385973 RepID=UPI00399FBA2E
MISAHPDDESLGIGGLVQELHARGTQVEFVIATDGEAAFPSLDEAGRRELRSTRRRELRAATAAQGIAEPRVRWLEFPDSGLAEREEELVERLRPVLAGADVCLAPWPGDPHPDHQAIGRAVVRAAQPGARVWTYPVWAWHWLDHEDPALPWTSAAVHPLSEEQRRRKSAALAAFESQTSAGPNAEEPVLPPEMMVHFQRDHEVLFAQPLTGGTPPERFAELYDARAEPWDVRSWYERRKRALALACLPEPRYGTALEPACGTGALTLLLASRCDRVLASDANAVAVERAREKLADERSVSLAQRSLPARFERDSADLLVWSEILYYLGDDALGATIAHGLDALRPGGDVLAVHWRHRAHDAPRDGAEVHRKLEEHPGLSLVASCSDRDFLVSVLRRR